MSNSTKKRPDPSLRLTVLTAFVLALTGCAVVPLDGGVSGLQQLAESKAVGFGNAAVPIARPGVDSTAAVNDLLKRPLTMEAAVRIALMNNPAWQNSLASAGVGITDAMLANSPAKLKAAQDITLLSAEARKAWVNAVAAAQTARNMAEAKEGAEAGGELARRMTRVGNLSKLQQAREQAALSDAAIQLARAQQAAFSEREKLIVVMGLWGPQVSFELPGKLPDLPAQARDLPDIEAQVTKERVDLRLAVTEWRRQLAAPPPSSADALWDAMRDSAKVRELAVKTRSEARQVYNDYRTAYDLARHYQDEVVPLRKFITDEVVLRYNGMLLSVFDLLADTRAQVLSVNSAIEAQRDFWLAEADLQTVLAGTSVGNSALSARGAPTTAAQ
ncbi:MAG: TolC family protein [Polaromonas sp.]|uniref:TolC family protein n=1 Tax=Polaromonas sp. TaxID=1869339 RepID=UPI001801D8DA|nr:TolC family protein [Polaromonas sp.]NMM11117.1 TolC family protein [Polaromonas sp.]